MDEHLFSIDIIRKIMENNDEKMKAAAMHDCIGRKDIPFDIIEKGLNDISVAIKFYAIRACQGRKVPVSVLKNGMVDEYEIIRYEITKLFKNNLNLFQLPSDINATSFENIPNNYLIKNGLSDPCERIRKSVYKFCIDNSIPIPLIRTFEPPEFVYKKCLNNVIVVASIPKDAQIRGAFGSQCRANKAHINKIIGDTYGKQIGISTYDHSTVYRIGDKIQINDFDFDFDSYATGFHFYCTMEEAKHY